MLYGMAVDIEPHWATRNLGPGPRFRQIRKLTKTQNRRDTFQHAIECCCWRRVVRVDLVERKELYILYAMLLTDLWCMIWDLFGFIIVASKPAIEDAARPAYEIASSGNKLLSNPVWPTDEDLGEENMPHFV